MDEAAPEVTIDGFHGGRFYLVQPTTTGHRAGTDAMILAAAVPSGFRGRLVDFGAGSGAVALAVISRCPGASALLVERSADMAVFATLSLARAENAHLRDRSQVLVADVEQSGSARRAAGLADNSFDFALMNPPFNEAGNRQTPDALRREAHVMDAGLLGRWLRSAAAVVKPRGGLAVIARPRALAELLVALQGRFGGAEIVPVHPHATAPAIRIVVRAVRGSRAGLRLCPPLILHDAGSSGFSSHADAIHRGDAALFPD